MSQPHMTHQGYNLLIADLFDRVPLEVIESHQAQTIIRYFYDKLTVDNQPKE